MEENINPVNKNITKDENLLKKEPIDNYEKDPSKSTNKVKGENIASPKNINNLEINENKIKKIESTTSSNIKIKPIKEIPIEKKPFNEFINNYLLPSIINEFNKRGFEVNNINLKNTSRPIAGDKCWVIYCDIKDICNFWLSFEKEDISSLKSISLCKSNQKPSVIESFLIDEKRITLQLIISRILQRLNGQKLIGIN